MIFKKKFRHKPIYKKFVGLKKGLHKNQNILKFKKRKWQALISQISRLSKIRKYNSYYKFYNQNFYVMPKFKNFFSSAYKQTLLTKKGFNVYYGKLGKKYLKKTCQKAYIKSNSIKNSVGPTLFFQEHINNRLDVVLYQSHFSFSIISARQLISHGHVYVNNKKVYDSSFQLKPNDVVRFSKKSHKLLEYYLLKSEVWPLPPKHLQVSYKIFQIIINERNLLFNNSYQFLANLKFNTVFEAYKNYSSVAQWQSKWLLTIWPLVRIQPEENIIYM